MGEEGQGGSWQANLNEDTMQRHTRGTATMRRASGVSTVPLRLATEPATPAPLSAEAILARTCELIVEEMPTGRGRALGTQRHYVDGCARYLKARQRGEASLPPCPSAFIHALCAMQNAGADVVHILGALALAMLERQRQQAAALADAGEDSPAPVLALVGREVAEASAAGLAYMDNPTPETARAFHREARDAETVMDRLRDFAARVSFTVVQGAKPRRVYGAR